MLYEVITDKDTYKVSGGLHGVGVSCVNALSTCLIAEVHRGGKVYKQEYSIGVPQGPLEETGTTDKTGTIVTFTPDGSIFTTTEYKYSILANRMRELAFLNQGITIEMLDHRRVDEEGNIKREIFFSEKGLQEFVEFIDEAREHIINEPIYINTEKNDVPVEIAILYNTSFSENVYSYVNNINTIEGGTHLTVITSYSIHYTKLYEK